MATGVLEQAHPVAGVLEFVDVGPDLCLPSLFVGGGFAASGATSVERNWTDLYSDRRCPGQFYEDAANFFDFFIPAKNVLVPQQVSESEFPRMPFRLTAGMERAVFRPQLFGGIASHPEDFFVCHRWFRPGSRSRLWTARAYLEIQLHRCNSVTADRYAQASGKKVFGCIHRGSHCVIA
jgi:hypothetical protein